MIPCAIQKDECMTALLMVSIALSIIFVYCLVFKKPKSPSSPPLPPGPRGFPIIGNILSLEPNLHSCLAELTRPYGPIMKIKMGTTLCIVVSSASIAREIIKDHDIIFANRQPTAAAYAGSWEGTDIFWTPYGDRWRMLRKICVSSLLSSSRLDELYDHRRKEVRAMVKEIYSEADTPIDIGDHVFRTMFSLMTNVMWGGNSEGQEMESFAAEFQKAMDETIDIVLAPNLSDLFPVFAMFDIQGLVRRITKIKETLEKKMEAVIARRLKMKDQGKMKDFLQVLLKLNESGSPGTCLTKTDITALILNLMGGGTTTLASTIEWAMTELIKEAIFLKKAQEEIDAVVGKNNIVEESHCAKLHYLNAVVKETMRLHPASPLGFPKYPSESCVVGGYMVPKGTKIFVNTWAIQRDPAYWDNPLEFRPERFLVSEENPNSGLDYNGQNPNYVPFGSGRRICVGIPLAERMVPYMLASLLHSFDWKLTEGTEIDMSETFSAELKKTIPLIAVPSPRLSDSTLYR